MLTNLKNLTILEEKIILKRIYNFIKREFPKKYNNRRDIVNL